MIGGRGKLTFTLRLDNGDVVTGELEDASYYVENSYDWVTDFAGRYQKVVQTSTTVNFEGYNPQFTITRVPIECWITGEMI